ncbi:hypothetical protein [Myxosarcina sp. GI1]|uniref:hypothetical protein n=1 Tax=Myxosarcina sp. GI1 TaxID=1541065 RepID=UPI00055B534E|nr:hypothetical protein [Myxosarcina sp. GI1]
MSWESEFNTQWQSFVEIVETLIRKEIRKTGRLNATIANNIVGSEVENWFISTHYNGAWLRKLTQRHPDLGKDFRSTLEELNFNREIALKSSLPILPIVMSLVFMAIIFFGLGRIDLLGNSLPKIAEWLKQVNISLPKIIEWLKQINSSPFRKIGLTILIGLTTFAISNSLRDRQKKRRINKLIDRIKLNLTKTGKNLSYIASKVDRLDLKTERKT